MAKADWMIRGPELATCNCDWGCPCQFNAYPTYGHCRAGVAMRIDDGYCANIRLDGLRWVSLFAWPQAIHEGNGEALAIIDERADEQQRAALLEILSGENSEPGATVFSVMASTITRAHDPVFAPIEFEVDETRGTGRFAVRGMIEADVAPISNPVTGETHRVKVLLRSGFEFLDAEFLSSRTRAPGPVSLDWTKGHAHLAKLQLTPAGPIR